MKRLLMIISALFAISLFMTPMVSWAARATVLRMAIPWPPMDPVTVQCQAFVDNFNKQAGGKYIIELHPGESLIKVMESIEALKMGVVEIAGWPVGMFASQDRRFASAEVPFLADSVEADAAMQVAMMPLYDQFMEKKFNSKPLFSFTCLALDVISTRPVKTAADWKGLLTHSVSPQSSRFIEAMNGAAVAMPFSEGYQGLQKGVVNASMQSSSMMIMFKMNEVGKYVLRGYLIPASLMISVNMDTFKKMPKDIQDLLVKTGKQAQKSANDYFVKIAQENTKTLMKVGVNVYNLPKKERNQWIKKLQPYCDSLLKEMGPEFSSKLKKIAAEMNAKYPYIY